MEKEKGGREGLVGEYIAGEGLLGGMFRISARVFKINGRGLRTFYIFPFL